MNELRQSNTHNQARLDEFRDQFVRSTRYGKDLVDYLRRSECGIWRYESDPFDRRRWWLNVTLPPNVAEMFDAHLELQLVYVEYENVEPRLLELLQQRIRKNARVDPGLVAVASLDSSVAQMARRRRGEFAVVDITLGGLDSATPDIRHQMARVLTSVDHFDVTSPIKDPGGFFGRRTEFDTIVSAIGRGQSIGVFGLRKTGKTSLLNYVLGRRIEAGRPVVWVDISGISGADDFRRRFVEAAFQTARRLGAGSSTGSRLRLRTIDNNGEPRGSIETLRSHWLRDLEAISEAAGARLEVFIDEIDQANPGRSFLGTDEGAQLLIALTQLRGMIQTAGPDAGIVLVCAGVDPALFERPMLASGADNLLYKLVRLMFLAPMTRDEMAEMVRDLGRRMGIRVRDHNTIDFLFDEYGGHPLLTRKACSLACTERPRDEIPWHMSVDSVRVAAGSRGDGTPLQQAAEILDSFTEWFPLEGDLLRSLWSPDGDESELARLEIEEDDARIQHAEPYGLVAQDRVTARIRAVERALRGA
jgi:hypothetical protein